MKINVLGYVLSLAFLLMGGCKESVNLDTSSQTEVVSVDPLPSWNEGDTKSAIISYVELVTTEGGDGFVPKEDRIATFDNDGNLWSEQPLYFQLIYAIEQIKKMASDHPEWKSQQAFKAVLEDNMEDLLKQGEKGILEIVMASHAGMTDEEFQEQVGSWLQTAKHPRFNQPYNAMVYQPMLELLDFLRDNGFKTFIVSGGGVDFMRVWVSDVYGIPTYQVVGSSIKKEFNYNEGKPNIRRTPALEFIDDKEGKPVGISKFIGKRPIFASGNSDGDLQMMQYTASNIYPSFMLYTHHTDAEREWAYDRDSHIGKLDKGLDEALERGWTIIDMAKDWKTVYPFQLENE